MVASSSPPVHVTNV
ncbi:unnamed protein product, partial [Rotaria magnacalcarata]